MRVIVYHGLYGCDTGCCGHYVEMGDKAEFCFEHPSEIRGEYRKFAEDLVRETFGEEHVKDLDWDNCTIVDD